MVLRFWDRSVDQYELAGHFPSFPIKGLSGQQLKELAARYGFSAHSFPGHAQSVRDHLSKGRPLILALSSSRLLNFNHFVVLVGWDALKQEWIVHDPADGPYRRRSAKRLTAQWDQLHNWTLLVLPQTSE
jgi:ABC-type bacteriocin/lantibiotic exporter with double-glycine peptidase domain